MTMRTTEANNYFEKRNSIAYEYIEFFEEMGYILVLIPNNTKNIIKYFKMNVHMVVLSGGNNVNPNIYNSNDILNDVYDERDETEKKLVDISIKQNIPILGICRGFHFINTYFGGSLEHDIKEHVNIDHNLKSNLSILDNIVSNSFHNQGIKKNNISTKLNILAYTNDGYIEAFVNKELYLLGIQWHPERQNKKYDKKLIKKFLKGKI